MGAPSATSVTNIPTASALQNLLSEKTSTSSPHPAHLQHLALQVLHNLQHQHGWTDLKVHDYSTHDANSADDADGGYIGHAKNKSLKRKRPIPRPLISGLPPQRLYVQPDEQIALLQAQKAAGGTGLGDIQPEREWVCPTHLREKWSLRRFAEVFEGVDLVPPEVDEDEEDDNEDEESDGFSASDITRQTVDGNGNGVDAVSTSWTKVGRRGHERADEVRNEWRTMKRVLLATVDDDSTVVYYIVHDGIVKPRQN